MHLNDLCLRCLSTILLAMTLFLHHCDGQCTFPTDFHNSVWTSTNFGTMTFTTTTLTVTKAVELGTPAAYQLSYECYSFSSTKFIMRTTTADTASFAGLVIYTYYCILYTKQNSDSYYYEANRAVIQNTTAFSFSSTECQSSNDPSSLNVMVKDPANAKQVCAEPILGSFAHDVSGCKNGTLTSACDSDKSSINVTYQTVSCSPLVYIGYSAEGFMYCALSTNSSSTYYQILYNPGGTSGTDTRTFSCLTITVTNTIADGNTTVSVQQRTCDERTSASFTTITLTSDSLCPVLTTVTPTTSTEPSDNSTILGAVLGTLAGLILIGAVIALCYYINRDPNKGKPIIENTKPRFEDPDLDDTIEDLETLDNAVSPVTRDDITIDAMSPTNIIARRANAVANGNIVNAAPGKEDFLNSSLNGSIANGYVGREIGNHFHEKPGDRPAPRVHKLASGKESMVIFNGDEKVISGNDSRVIPNENPTARSMSFRLDMSGATTYKSVDETGAGGDNTGDSSYPSFPREKSNLMPPIETSDTPKEKRTFD